MMAIEDRRHVTDNAGGTDGSARALALSRPTDCGGSHATRRPPADPEWSEVLRGLCERLARQSGHAIGPVSLSLRLDDAPGESLAAARLCEQIAADYGLKARAVPSNHEVMIRLTRSEKHERVA